MQRVEVEGEGERQREKNEKNEFFPLKPWGGVIKLAFLHALHMYFSTKYNLKIDNNHLLSGSHWHINGSICKS